MKVWQAREKDIPQLATLFDQYRVIRRQHADLATTQTFLQERLVKKETIIFLAGTRNNLYGFAQLYPMFLSIRLQRFWLLTDIYVVPAAVGKGAVTALLNACRSLCLQTPESGLIIQRITSNLTSNKVYVETGTEIQLTHQYYTWDRETEEQDHFYI